MFIFKSLIYSRHNTNVIPHLCITKLCINLTSSLTLTQLFMESLVLISMYIPMYDKRAKHLSWNVLTVRNNEHNTCISISMQCKLVPLI